MAIGCYNSLQHKINEKIASLSLSSKHDDSGTSRKRPSSLFSPFGHRLVLLCRLSWCLELTRKHSSPAPSSGGFTHKIDKTSVNHLVITIHQASVVAIETCNKLIKPDQNCKGKINITDIIISAAKRTRKRPMSVSKANCIFPSARVNCI